MNGIIYLLLIRIGYNTNVYTDVYTDVNIRVNMLTSITNGRVLLLIGIHICIIRTDT